MLKARDFRQSAWDKLKGQWGTMALTTLLVGIITGAASSLAGIGGIIVAGPFEVSQAQMYLNISRGETEKFENMFEGFKGNIGSAILAYVLINIFVFLWSLLFFIPGIIKGYSYAMTYFVLADNPDMAPNEARKRSMELMRGNKWRLFCLDFSFIGWALLSILTFGILTFWITPYQRQAYAEFYESITPESERKKEDAESAGDVPCPKCGAKNVKNAAFCTSCGAPMPLAKTEPVIADVHCPNCGSKNDSDSAFCTSCGAKLK